MTIRTLLIIAVYSLIVTNGSAVASSHSTDDLIYRNPAIDFETRAVDLVERMTLEEKISQLGDKSKPVPRLGLEEYNWWNECLHGVARAGTATVFPQAIGMAATFDRAMLHEVACAISDEARAKHHEAARKKDFGRYKGLTFWSPNINIFRDPRWGRGHETYGEDPYLTGQMGMQFVRGLQGDDPKYLKLVATAKHFAVHNGPEPERHTFNAVPNARDLWETYLPAFYDLVVTAKAYSVMGAYNRVDGESASASWMLLEDILRNQWKFDGYVVSDCRAISDIYKKHKIVDTAEQAAAIGVRRGCDLNCGDVYQKALLKAVKEGLIDEGEIDLAVYRLMLARMKLGMFDPPTMVSYATIPYSVNDCPAHDALALKMAQKSLTLLKNDGVLPLNKKKIKTLAVVGPNADSVAVLRGNYHGDASHPVTVLQGIRRSVGNDVKVLYSKGCPLVQQKSGDISGADWVSVDSKYLFAVDSAGQKVSGLKGQYFRGTQLKGSAVMTRIDRQIDMDWQEGSPTDTALAQGIVSEKQTLAADNFSVRWTGQLVPPVSGTYTLGVASDDGCRLFINGRKIVDGWSDHSMQTFSADIKLQKGKSYDVTVEYYEAAAGAVVKFVWKRPDAAAVKSPLLTAGTLENARQADVVVFVGGLDATWEGEEMRSKVGIEGFNKGDRTKIKLPDVQLKTLRALQQTGKPIVFVLLAGSAIGFDGINEQVDAVLMGWYPGQRGGDAVADALFGDINPAGRLPVTFYTSVDELADFRDYNMTAGKGQTYRYYTGTPSYSFGHGLSYTEFKYSDLKIDRTTLSDQDEFTVSVKLSNVGDYDGEEVVQLYVRDVESHYNMPIKQLRGFERILLKKGDSQTVTFKLNAGKDLRYYDSFKRRYSVEPGLFEIQVGASSTDIRLTKSVVVR